MRIFGVDPGPKSSGWCYLNIEDNYITEIEFGHNLNRIMLTKQVELGDSDVSEMVIGYEWVKNYGRVVGEDVLRTAYTCGRVRANGQTYGRFYEPTRPTIIKHFTGRSNLPKSQVRKALLDRFGDDRVKSKGGILHGITNHAWDALAVCMYLCEEEYNYGKEYWRSSCIF